MQRIKLQLKRLLTLRKRYRKYNKYFRFVETYLFPFLTVVAVVLVRFGLQSKLPQSPYLLFTLLVFFHAWYGGVRSGLLAGGLSVLVANYYFTEPTNQFKFDNFGLLFQTSIFIFQSLIISIIIGRSAKTMSDLNAANKRLAYGQEQLRDTIDSVFTLITIVNPDGTIVEANATFAKMFSHKWDDIVGRNITGIFLWAYDPEVKQRLIKALASADLNVPVRYDEKLKVGEDKYMDMTLSIVAVDDTDDGIPDFFIISGIDITERKDYEEDLEYVRSSYEKLVNSNIIGMGIIDLYGNLLEVNNALVDMLGYPKEELLLSDIRKQLIPKDFANPDSEAFKQITEKGVMEPTETELNHKNGHKVPVMISGVVIDEDTDRFLCLVVNLTSQKELQQRKDEFISIASHELKTPLTTIKGYTQLLGDSLQKRFDENVKFVGVLNNQINKLNDLVNELLDISRIQSGKLTINKTDFSLTEFVEEVMKEAEVFSAQHKIVLKSSADDVMINADRFRVNQVLMNFLTNAIKYSPDADKINIFITSDDKEVKVSVQDFGLGINKDKLPLIFGKFFQVDSNSPDIMKQGLGLGLYISAEIIKSHGGRVGVDSKIDKGSTFYFILPLHS